MPKTAKKKATISERELYKKLRALWMRADSDLCEVRGSKIHGRGVYAIEPISEGEKIIEYVGELISKDESDKRGVVQHDKAVENGDAAVYIFNVSKKYDIDGDVPWNTARLINHSCSPNREALQTGRRIYIHALKDIRDGDELTFDYGFDVECYEDHPCKCGSEDCVGYIVSREQWGELREKIAQKKKTKDKRGS